MSSVARLPAHIDIERCPHCGGALKVIAAIEEPPLHYQKRFPKEISI